MNSPSNSICTTVSKRPAELKPITASLCSWSELHLAPQRGGHRRRSRPLRRRRHACAGSPRLSPRPSGNSCLRARRRDPYVKFISVYLHCKLQSTECVDDSPCARFCAQRYHAVSRAHRPKIVLARPELRRSNLSLAADYPWAGSPAGSVPRPRKINQAGNAPISDRQRLG